MIQHGAFSPCWLSSDPPVLYIAEPSTAWKNRTAGRRIRLCFCLGDTPTLRVSETESTSEESCRNPPKPPLDSLLPLASGCTCAVADGRTPNPRAQESAEGGCSEGPVLLTGGRVAR